MREKKRAFTVRLPDDLVKKIDHLAVESRLSRSAQIEYVLSIWAFGATPRKPNPNLYNSPPPGHSGGIEVSLGEYGAIRPVGDRYKPDDSTT